MALDKKDKEKLINEVIRNHVLKELNIGEDEILLNRIEMNFRIIVELSSNFRERQENENILLTHKMNGGVPSLSKQVWVGQQKTSPGDGMGLNSILNSSYYTSFIIFELSKVSHYIQRRQQEKIGGSRSTLARFQKKVYKAG